MNTVNLIAVFAQNSVGLLARVTKVIADAGVNIRWLTIATEETFGVLKLIVDRPDLAFARLREAGWTVSRVEVLAVEVPDQPGKLYGVLDCLARSGINVENSSGWVSNNQAVLLLEVADVAAASRALGAAGIRILSQKEALAL